MTTAYNPQIKPHGWQLETLTVSSPVDAVVLVDWITTLVATIHLTNERTRQGEPFTSYGCLSRSSCALKPSNQTLRGYLNRVQGLVLLESMVVSGLVA